MIFQIEIEFVAAPGFFQMLTPAVSDRLLPSTQYTIGSLVLYLLSSFSVCLWQRNSRLVPLNFAWFSAFFVRICEKLNSLISDATGVCFSIWARETLILLVYQFRAFNSFFVVMECGFQLGLICSLSYLYHLPRHTTFLPKVEGNLIRWKSLNEENLSNKEIVLQQALHLMTTSFGKGCITWTWLGRFVSPIQVAVVCTGSCALDMALGIGGIPKGRVVEIYGLEASVTSALKIWILFVAVLFVLWKSGFMFSDYE